MDSATLSGHRISKRLSDELGELSVNQLEAVIGVQSASVIAGPGSGKTRVLVAKASLLLESIVVEPHKVACITFTRSATVEIYKRIGTLSSDRSRRAIVGTVHSFCLNSVLRPYGHLVGMPPLTDSILSYAEQVALLQRAFDAVGIGEQVATKRLLDGAGTRIRRRIAVGEEPDERDDPRLYAAMRLYDDSLIADGTLDFEAMPIQTLRLLRRNPAVVELIRAKYPWVLVDEYQDLGGVLHEIVQVLRLGGVKIFAVGDPNQCIMGFAGASPKYFYEFRGADAVDPFTLDKNFRCSAQVAAAASLVLQAEGDPSKVSLVPDDDTGFVRILEFPGGFGQHAQATAVGVGQILAGASSQTVGILYKQSPLYPGGGRKIEVREELVGALSGAGIEFDAERGNLYPRSDLIDFLRECAAWSLDTSGFRPSAVLIRDLARSWSRLTGAIGRADRVDSMARLYAVLSTSVTEDVTVSSWIGTLDSALGIRKDLLAYGSIDNLESFDGLFYGDAGASSILELAGRALGERNVTLTTYHSAKGREWDFVFLPYVLEGHVPGWFRGSPGTASELAENRRALHVAASRARVGTVILTASKTAGPPRFGQRSRFLSAF